MVNMVSSLCIDWEIISSTVTRSSSLSFFLVSIASIRTLQYSSSRVVSGSWSALRPPMTALCILQTAMDFPPSSTREKLLYLDAWAWASLTDIVDIILVQLCAVYCPDLLYHAAMETQWKLFLYRKGLSEGFENICVNALYIILEFLLVFLINLYLFFYYSLNYLII